ncbi:MAG: hypothetical protein JRN20_20710 [Nitrososphaerota archaeon]|nr:hypothetical protein [Nitrososphaerota archaeon]
MPIKIGGRRIFGSFWVRALFVTLLPSTGVVAAVTVNLRPVNAALPTNSVTGNATGSSYWIAGSSPRGQLQSGQNADILLSGIGFNNTGGSLLFNHLGGMASDGKHLVVVDRNNNRILVWNSLPSGNVLPDLVLGQKTFQTNNPGTGLNQLDWPTAVAMTQDGKLAVADAYNNRILIWNTFPTTDDQPADIAIYGAGNSTNPLRNIVWPWGVWTNGTFFAVSSTFSGTVLIWKHFPTENNQSADYYITGGGEFGTPRDIISNSKSLLIYDHNARAADCSEGGTLVWKNFP